MNFLVFYDAADATTAITISNLGTCAPGSSADSQYFVYNTSDSFQANDVTITLAGPQADQIWLSLDGDRFTASVELGDIAPNAGSLPLYLRRVTPTGTAQGAACAAQLIATPSSWSDAVDYSLSTNIGLEDPDAPEIDVDADPYAPPAF